VAVHVHIGRQPCIVTNNISHKSQHLLKAIDQVELFNVTAFNIWYPGTVTEEAVIKKS
jgi:hypothetical protein